MDHLTAGCAPFGRLPAVTNGHTPGRFSRTLPGAMSWAILPRAALPAVAYPRLRMVTPCGRITPPVVAVNGYALWRNYSILL
jgi:hypothetical protein